MNVIDLGDYGSLRELEKLCDLLGVSNLADQVKAYSSEQFEKYVRSEATVNVCQYSIDAPEYYGVCFIENRDEWPKPGACVASLCPYEEGPHWELPLYYLQTLLERQLEMIRWSEENAEK